jgi:mannose-6-phosphate isomerase-like protein (cupin superfamily)
MVIVETRDAVLVTHKDRTQDVKRVVDWLATEGRNEARSQHREYYPWGYREKLGEGKSYDVERLTVNPGAVGLWEPRGRRGEHWIVVTGTAKVTSDDGERRLHEHESGHFFCKGVSRFENVGSHPLEVVVVQFG